MMMCEDYRTQGAYLAEDDPAVRRAAEEHLGICEECRRWRSEYMDVMAVYASTVTEQPSRKPVRERHVRSLLLAAATLAAVAVGFVLLQRMNRSPVHPVATQAGPLVSWDDPAPSVLRSGLTYLDEPKDDFDQRVEQLRGQIAQIAVEVSADTF
ncbi:MAG: hypothetical protein HYX75_23855 [Acidobacteria bacterium]|nr:hypothetical protein [Acidobacteriota bacterium]